MKTITAAAPVTETETKAATHNQLKKQRNRKVAKSDDDGEEEDDEKKGKIRRLLDAAGETAYEHPWLTGLTMTVAGQQLSSRVVDPLATKIANGVRGVIAKKAVEKVKTEAKNAFSIGDVLSSIGSAVGKLK